MLIHIPLGRPCFLPVCSLFPLTPSFVRRFKLSQNLDIKDTPGLMNSPSSISISLRRRMTNIAPMLYFRRGRGRPSSKAISHISGVPWPRSPRHSPSPPPPDICPPSGLGRRASIISEPDMACTDSLVSPSFPRLSEMFPSTHIIPPSARFSFQTAPQPRPHTQLTRIPSLPCILSLPDRVRARTCTATAPAHHSVRPTGIRTAQPTARPTAGGQSPPILLSLVLAHVTCSRLLVLARVSKRFSAAAQLALYRTLELSADDADACVAQPAGASHLAAPALRAYPPLRTARPSYSR
ncbi:hypothetical protein EDB84DRAFT_1224463 [Lactarius hengduanensis]|nr:hypothetical protein EDB84DRAFT_1224463 [Lactarius hengduanensis]